MIVPVFKAAGMFLTGLGAGSFGIGVAAMQVLSGESSLVGEVVAGSSFVVAFALLRFSYKVMSDQKEIADAREKAALFREQSLRESEATAWAKVAELREQLAVCRDEYANERDLRVSLEQAGIKDRRHKHTPPEGTPI